MGLGGKDHVGSCSVSALVLLLLFSHSFMSLCNPKDYSPPGSSLHGILQEIILEWFAIPFPGDLPDPGINPMSPALQADSLPSEPPGKLPALVQSLSNTVKLGCNLFCTF